MNGPARPGVGLGLSLWGNRGSLGHRTTDCPEAFTDNLMRTLPMQDAFRAKSPPPLLPSAPCVLALAPTPAP